MKTLFFAVLGFFAFLTLTHSQTSLEQLSFVLYDHWVIIENSPRPEQINAISPPLKKGDPAFVGADPIKLVRVDRERGYLVKTVENSMLGQKNFGRFAPAETEFFITKKEFQRGQDYLAKKNKLIAEKQKFEMKIQKLEAERKKLLEFKH